ncbi:hypothetical protein C3432_01805 [Citrobacter amalonaticus]|uniref:Carrier domain-containing protein n=1 Tax=Citrobacter amalonaticus TaxID=35703 RepID=A0A2S4S2H1_CITAM|nr:acyl carrier protein [Citrobacter amalonaticus]POT59481.1 hypothetical protein C3432_01805 [Citrobacter amalonaticus]POT77611.1 hypothetical protein C3436_09475 [Citrobacter amalonaticus]POU68063.1 hypothetical protein C3430_03010 [Citrobacter amalonaticus]POV07667.1 hypothetical protein C3424_03020 [Citrobacter amalonaticus]
MNSIEKVNQYLLSEVAKIKSLPQGSFTIDSHILYDLYFDSVDLIDLLTSIEEDLHVAIDDDELEKFTTLSSISRVIMHYSNMA